MKTNKLLGNLEIATFCEQLALVVSAGMPTYEGVSILMEDAADEETSTSFFAISKSLSFMFRIYSKFVIEHPQSYHSYQ